MDTIKAWLTGIRAQAKRLPFWVWWVALAFAAGLWLGCAPDAARAAGAKPNALTATAVRTGAGTFKLVLTWRNKVDPGGPPDSIRTAVGVDPNWTSQYQIHWKPFAQTTVKDSFNLTSTPGVTLTGQASVLYRRRGLTSDTVRAPWTYTEADVPPVPPDSFSVKVSAVEVVPGTVALYFGGTKQFCALLTFSTGQKALVGGQRGIAACEAVEAALPALQRATTTQYAAAGVWLSCIDVAAGKECRHADGSIAVVAGAGPRFRLTET